MDSLRVVLRSAIMLTAMSILAVAQQQQSGEQTSPQNTILKPKMTVGDILFAINVLNTVEIKGSEVEAFLDVKNVLVKAVENAQKEKKTETDELTIEMNLLTANNFLNLFQRANIPGSAAERFQTVKQALFASAAPLQSQSQQKR